MTLKSTPAVAAGDGRSHLDDSRTHRKYISMRRKTIAFLIIVLLLALMQLYGLIVRVEQHQIACYTIEQSKASQLFVKELNIAMPGFETSWIEKQCDYYALRILGFVEIASWKSVRDDYVLVAYYEGGSRRNWPKYNNVNFRNNLNSGVAVLRFKRIEDFDPSKITIGP